MKIKRWVALVTLAAMLGMPEAPCLRKNRRGIRLGQTLNEL